MGSWDARVGSGSTRRTSRTRSPAAEALPGRRHSSPGRIQDVNKGLVHMVVSQTKGTPM